MGVGVLPEVSSCPGAEDGGLAAGRKGRQGVACCTAFFFFKHMCLFIWLHLVSARGIYFRDQGPHLGPLLWEHGVLAAGPLGNSCVQHLNSF